MAPEWLAGARRWLRPQPLTVALLALSVLALEVSTFWRGIDFWDESYVLLLIDRSDAARNAGEVFLFQFLLHPVLDGVGRDVGTFRLVGLLVLAGAAAAATAATGRRLSSVGVPAGPLGPATTSVSVAAASVTAYVGAGRAPGYRLVVLVGLLIAVVGLCLLVAGRPGAGAAVLGSAGVLVFTGKPTTAAALGVLVLVAVPLLVPARRLWRVGLGGGVGVALAAVVVMLAARMGPGELLTFLARGVEIETATGAHGSWASMLGLSVPPLRVLLLLGPMMLVPLAVAVVDVRHGRTSAGRRTLWVVLGVLVPGVVGVLGVLLLSAQEFGGQIVMLTALWGLLSLALLVRAKRRRVPRAVRVMVAVLLVLPYVATVGTNTNFAQSMAQSSVFWALALVLVLRLSIAGRPTFRALQLPVCVFVVATTAVVQVVWLADALEGREVVRATATAPVLGGRLALTSETADLLRRLHDLGDAGGLVGRPSVDLTGYGAGYQLALGTRPLGRASFFGTFEGADRGAAVALSRESCRDRAEAVVLIADDDPLDVRAAVADWDVSWRDHYREIARFRPTHGTEPIRRQWVRLLAPTPRVAVALGCPAQP